MDSINHEIAKNHEERLALLQDYSPTTYAEKRGRLHDLEARNKALFERKRAMLAAQRKARDE